MKANTGFPDTGTVAHTRCRDDSAHHASAEGSGAYIIEALGRYNWDVSWQKKFRLRESHVLQFRPEFCNLPNSFSFSNPNTSFYSTAFGQVYSF
jgi:hypothetical protein